VSQEFPDNNLVAKNIANHLSCRVPPERSRPGQKSQKAPSLLLTRRRFLEERGKATSVAREQLKLIPALANECTRGRYHIPQVIVLYAGYEAPEETDPFVV
jgi:hypothetical protein